MHPSVASGSILLSMGCGSFCHSHARSPRFREVLSNADGSRSAPNLRSVCENHVVNSAFHDDVAKTRMFLNQSSHPKLFNHAMTDSICYASRILEEAFVPPGFHTSGYICEISKTGDHEFGRIPTEGKRIFTAKIMDGAGTAMKAHGITNPVSITVWNA